jgi:hypothetical protein
MSLVCPLKECREKKGPCKCEKIGAAVVLLAVAVFTVLHFVG